MMMIAGFVVTAATSGQLLDPFSPARLVAVAGGVAAVAFLVACLAVWRVERAGGAAAAPPASSVAKVPFRDALAQVWHEAQARRFSVFIFVSMLAYSAQDLILEPFAGIVFGLTPGQSTSLAGVQHGGVLLGMIVVALCGSVIGGRYLGSLKLWTVGGCLASAVAVAALAMGGLVGPGWPLKPTVFALGAANGAFAVAAIGSMMGLASQGRAAREGVRMGLWGAAQAIAFALGGFAGTVAVDALNLVAASPVTAYSSVFAAQAVLFVVSAYLAARVGTVPAAAARGADREPTTGVAYAAGMARQ
jgi:BCD family chlorophyll transporter-like MFS transporter